jgi:hypothetical protein
MIHRNYIEMSEGVGQPGPRLLTVTVKAWGVEYGRTD